MFLDFERIVHTHQSNKQQTSQDFASEWEDNAKMAVESIRQVTNITWFCISMRRQCKNGSGNNNLPSHQALKKPDSFDQNSHPAAEQWSASRYALDTTWHAMALTISVMTGKFIEALEFCTHYRKFLRLPITWSWGILDNSSSAPYSKSRTNPDPNSTAIWEQYSAANTHRHSQ